MVVVPPLDAPLPHLFDPILDYLSSSLPPPVYNTLVTVASQSVALVTSLFTLTMALFPSSSSTWDAQTILPPLITLLAAYLALVSFYRTTWWMIRTGFWFIKWGTILAVLTAGAGWVMSNANANGGSGVGVPFAGGFIPVIGGFLLDMLNGQGQNAAGGARSNPRPKTQSQSTRSRSRPQNQPKSPRPKAWESWDRHREWQYNENEGTDAGSEGEVKKVIGDIIGAAGRVLSDGRWWEAAKGAVDEFAQVLGESGGTDDGRGEEYKKQSTRTNTKAKAGSR
ncbi:hypothetical protein SCP_0307840 [Sparassis crispa]|uniref:Uncharacterized protein n=1 Tax=Sparassis crispa TaxID=139825 RepID=A0A401GFV9_9APHY|nr:hypothetical protein SCP_0307840 [Sparassis crispa]GBE81060.1 hypothetical protein SCP_0307840 [Sparassis crispa]